MDLYGLMDAPPSSIITNAETFPMHPEPWGLVLFNLYSSKTAPWSGKLLSTNSALDTDVRSTLGAQPPWHKDYAMSTWGPLAVVGHMCGGDDMECRHD